MNLLKYAAYGIFALGGLTVAFAIDQGEWVFIAGALWSAILGLALLAADRALVYLREIRDALVVGKDAPEETRAVVPAVATATAAPTKSVSEIKSDLDRMKKSL